MMGQRQCLAGLASIVVLAPSTLTADIRISELAWQNQAGAKLVIDGEDFGSAPNVKLFDTFDEDTKRAETEPSETPLVFSRSPSELDGTAEDLDDLRITREDSFSGDSGAVIVNTGTDYQSRLLYREPGDETPQGTGAFQQIYFSYAIKDLGDFPGPDATEDSFSPRASAKDAWLMLGFSGNGGAQNEDDNPWAGNDLVIPSWVGGGFSVGGNSTDLGRWKWQGELRDNWEFGDWNQMFFYAKVDSESPLESGSGFFGFANDNAFNLKRRPDSFMSDPDKKHYWDRIKFGSWYRLKTAEGEDVTEVRRLHDEVYIATGPNAHARAMLGDNDKLSDVTRLHHGVPVDWQDERIVVDFSHVDLDSADEWHVFVFNADSTVEPASRRTPDQCAECPVPPPELRIK